LVFISIEGGKETFLLSGDLLIDIIDHKLNCSFSKSTEIAIPSEIVIRGPLCFFFCESLASVSFLSNSKLRRIGSPAFLNSSLQSILIPRTVQFIDGSAFGKHRSLTVSIEPGNERFIIREELLIDIVDHKLIWNFLTLPEVTIPCDIEIIGPSSLCPYPRFNQFVSFEPNLRLKRVESDSVD
jgi:hypothetical protein